MSDNSGAAGFFIFLGIIGIGVFLATRQGGDEDNYAKSYLPANWKRIYPIQEDTPATLYKNKEEWEIVRGSDRLIEKIVVHRTVTQDAR